MINLGPELPGGEFTFDVDGRIASNMRRQFNKELFEIRRATSMLEFPALIDSVGEVCADNTDEAQRTKDELARTFKHSGRLALAQFMNSDLTDEEQSRALQHLTLTSGSLLTSYDRHHKIADRRTTREERNFLLTDSAVLVARNHLEITDSLDFLVDKYTCSYGKDMQGQFALHGFSYAAHLLDVATGHIQQTAPDEDAINNLDINEVYKFLLDN